jgi:hypothetical protein
VRLIQREKMASVGELLAGVAPELDNSIGFGSANVSTLEDFVGRVRRIVDAYRTATLPEVDRARITGEWETLKIDYALRHLDPMLKAAARARSARGRWWGTMNPGGRAPDSGSTSAMRS